MVLRERERRERFVNKSWAINLFWNKFSAKKKKATGVAAMSLQMEIGYTGTDKTKNKNK